MLTAVKVKIRNSIHKLGWDLHRLSPILNPYCQFKKSLEQVRVDLILDIGANTGQFGLALRSVGYRQKIVSFEPLAEPYKALVTVASHDPLWRVHPRSAIGDIDGEIEINVSANSVSSSVLPMLRAHEMSAAGSAYIATQRVPIARLDAVLPGYLEPNSRYFLKIDTQGFEWQVLDGAKTTLAAAQGVMCELSLVPLYDGQRLWREIIERLEGAGFTLWAIQRGFTDRQTGRSMQMDGIFLRLERVHNGAAP